MKSTLPFTSLQALNLQQPQDLKPTPREIVLSAALTVLKEQFGRDLNDARIRGAASRIATCAAIALEMEKRG